MCRLCVRCLRTSNVYARNQGSILAQGHEQPPKILAGQFCFGAGRTPGGRRMRYALFCRPLHGAVSLGLGTGAALMNCPTPENRV